MALDHDGLFAVIGKFVKTINTVNGYVSALNSAEDEIFAILEDEGLQRYYADPINIPAQFDSFQGQVAQWIAYLITNVQNILVDRDYVIDQLNLFNFTVTDVLNALYDYMIDNSETIKSSVVSLDSADVDKTIVSVSSAFQAIALTYTEKTHGIVANNNGGEFNPVLMCYRILDGVNSPGNNVSAHLRYDGIESQLAQTSTVYAEVISNSSIGGETAQLFSGVSAVQPYQILTENPGNGNSIQNIESNNLITTNFDFSEWNVTDTPLGWSMSGTVTTDYKDLSGTGNGPLRINTQGVTASQQVTGLQHNTAYVFAVKWGVGHTSGASSNRIGIRLKKASGTSVVAQVTLEVDDTASEGDAIIYLPFRLPVSVDLTDLWVEIEYDQEGGTSDDINIFKAVLAPMVYFNGLAWAWWAPYHTTAIKDYVQLGHLNSIEVSNNNNGVFQTFFRRAFAVQLPTADSPTIADSLAT